MSPSDRSFVRALAELAYCNPFSPRRPELEKQALADAYRGEERVWSLTLEDPAGPLLNGEKIAAKAEGLLPALKSAREYEDVVLYWLYYRYSRRLYRDPAEPGAPDEPPVDWSCFGSYLADWRRLLGERSDEERAAHVFAIFRQMRRAFYAIYRHIIGSSLAAARLRAAVWESIFTHDMRRYRDGLYRYMGDFSTLITGPSGTGKELVARAIALSRYIPFDPRRGVFVDEPEPAFHAVNLAALSPTLIESELFGHRRGAFTGATQDRQGWLEACPPHGAVFLDEIGELDPTIQVKLLRVIQTRTFQRVGETTDREFSGKLIAATNRDLAGAMREGAFREDFYYRLCSDLIETVPLAQQLREDRGVLRQLVRFMAKRICGDGFEDAAAEAQAWIERSLGEDYPWPGNYRELEQCVRNVLIRGEYRPATAPAPVGMASFFAEIDQGTLSADELLGKYCARVYAHTGSYAEAARRLGVDHRTVKAKLDRRFLSELRDET